MNEKRPIAPMTLGHGADEGMRALEDAHRLYRRTLAAWVGDLLVLRRACGGRPQWPDTAGSWKHAA